MNKLTPEQIESNLAAYKHAMEVGHWKNCEWQAGDGSWWDGNFSWPSTQRCYRLRLKPPEPKWRAWKPEEVPLGVWVRMRHWVPGAKSLLICNSASLSNAPIAYIQIWGDSACPENISTEDALSDCEVSLDHGKTWQPAGVREE